MKRKLCLIVLSLLAMGAASAQSSTEPDTFTCNYTTDIDQDGDGLIEICDIEGLNAIRYQKDGTGYRKTSTSPKITTGCPADGCKGYELTGNLDLSEEDNWLPINSFTGIFEGNGYTISNLKINRPNTYYIGLFSDITRGSEIKNIGLLNVDIKGDNYVGGLVGKNDGNITDSYVAGSVEGDWYVGGLIGKNNEGNIANSYATGSVFGKDYTGGLVGLSTKGSITDSYATGSVDAVWYVGGLVGLNRKSSIANSYATGSVVGQMWYAGGLVGKNVGNITDSYATGSVVGDEYVGGLVGKHFGRITGSYATGSVVGDEYVGGLVGWNDDSITNSYATDSVDGDNQVGGLVGWNDGSITNSYATGSVDGDNQVGGLVGRNDEGSITNSYATGSVDGQWYVSGLVGRNDGGITDSYWDTVASGISTSNGGIGKTTAELQSPTTATGIYSNWSADNWAFGTALQYPILKDENGDLLSPPLHYGLSRLRLTEGYLTPDFITSTLNYAGTVVNNINTIYMIPTAANPDARIRIESGEINDDITSGSMSSKIILNPIGITTITITVINSEVTTKYDLHINYYRFNGDVDKDNDGLIEIDNVEGLNAIRYQADGTGYRKQAQDPKVTIGCPAEGCKGYELTANLDLSGRGNWLPINFFQGIFEGNGHTISNLKINRSDTNRVGLFSYIGRHAEINNIGLLNVDIKGNNDVGSLVGRNGGSITNSYATGSVDGRYWVGGLTGRNYWGSIANSHATGSVDGSYYMGGLVGQNGGTIANSYATGSVDGGNDVGGLVGENGHTGSITNSYATGSVDGSYYVGGLVGDNNSNITDSYATGSVDGRYSGGLVGWNGYYGSVANSYATGSVRGNENVGGLVGRNDGSIANSYATGFVRGNDNVGGLVGWDDNGSITDSYWDTVASRRATSDSGIGKTTAELQSPIAATGIYRNWSTDNWYFGTASQYPVLIGENGNLLPTALRRSLRQLRLTEGYLSPDFIDSALNYTGTVVNGTNTIRLIPTAANPDARIRIDSGEVHDDIASGATSSEITLNPVGITTITIVVINSALTIKYNLSIHYYRFNGDVDKDDDGLIEIDSLEGLNAIRYQPDGTGYRTSSDTPKITIGCPADGCKGYELTTDLELTGANSWLPINAFTGIFEGNGHTISNLKIYRPDTDNVGLFGDIRTGSEINNISLSHVVIKGNNRVGSLVGQNSGSITNSYATAHVNHVAIKGNNQVGSLVGQNSGSITNSYATAHVNGDEHVGGLVGLNYRGTIAGSYATGSANGDRNVGGLVGRNYRSTIAGSYATGSANGSRDVGGLVGRNYRGTIANSYWDTVASGRATSDGGTGKTTTELQSPTTATGIYSSWSTDNWDFGTSGQLPILKYHDACTTTIGQPICGAFLPNQGTGLRTLEASASHVVPLLPVFSSEQSEYIADIPPDTDSINLRLISYDADATFEIRKQGENTNYFTDNEKSTIAVTDGEILTIQVTGAVADTAATTTTTYTLQMSAPPITLSEISVTKDGKDTGNTVSEGDDITLRTTVVGSSGGYQYKWATSEKTLDIPDSSTDTLSIKIPDDFVKSAATTSAEVVIFTVTATDSENDNISVSTVSIALTVMKQNNGDLVVGLEEEHGMNSTTLTAVVRTGDPDGYDPDTIDYQWQKQVEGSGIWIDTDSAVKTYAVPRTTVDMDYRVKIKYTDNQGYRATAMTESYRYEAPEWKISVPEVAEDNTADTDNTVNEGSEITLNVIGGSGDYQYEWTQTPENSFSIPPAGSDELGFDIPYNFIKSATTTNSNVTFTVTITDSENHAITETKTLTVMKIDNSEPIIEALVGGTTLTAVVSDADDYDDNPNNNKATYQWQKRDGGSWVNIDEASTAIYKIPSATHLGVSHRVIVEYTDDQGYEKKVEKIYPGATTHFVCDYALDIDQDDDGLIEICSLEGLNAIRYQPDGTGYRTSTDTTKITIGCPADGCKGYELAANLDLSEEDNWLPIKYFAGIFEGNGYTISNLRINRLNTDDVGLFGYVKRNSEIRNISLLNVDIKGDGDVGGLAGRNLGSIVSSYATGSVNGGDYSVGGLVGWNNGNIANSYATGSVNGVSNYVGGLVGWNYGNIANSHATGSVNGWNWYVGGLVGWNYGGSITSSYATGSVNGKFNVGGLAGGNNGGITNSYTTGPVYGSVDVGGLVGWNYGNIANSYATGPVDGKFNVGGLVGQNYTGSIANSYAVSSVKGDQRVGGLVGRNYRGTIANSYWDTVASERATSAAGTGKTTAALQSPTTATGIYSSWSTDNWDFGTSVQLPILKYHDACTTTTGQPICGAFLPNQGTGLRTLEASTSHVVRLLPVFSSEQSEYMADTPPNTKRINLRLISYDAEATFEIRKQGEDTNYFTGNEKSSIPVNDGEMLTIQVTGAAADTAATTITSYTLQIGFPTLEAISVTEDGKDTGGTVSEGDDITLRATGGSSGDHQYKWEQTSGEPLATTGTTTDTLNIKIPDDFVKSAATTSAEVTFTVTVTDSENHAITESKILTIEKIDNSEPIIEVLMDGPTLTAVVTDADDYDGNPNNNEATYQWQKRDSGSWVNIDEASTAIYKIPSATNLGVSHRVIIEYTDDQGYEKEVEKVYPVECNYAVDIDQDDDGLIEICDIEGLNAIRYQPDGTGYKTNTDTAKVTIGCPAEGCKGYELTGNLDLSAVDNWLPIESLTSIFEGNGHTISNLRINRLNTDDVGLFGYVKRNSEIRNISLLNVDIKGDGDVGGLAGRNLGSIVSSYATGSVNGGDYSVGGLVGWNNGNIANSYATGSVNGYSKYVGGLVGWNYGNIANSHATGSVNGWSWYVGGLVGWNYRGSITNSYATGSVNGKLNVGGLAGGNDGSIANSYATSPVDGSGDVGGLVGWNYGNIANSYATGSVNGQWNVGGLVGDNYTGSIANSYATGSVKGYQRVGGLIGRNYRGTIANSYWDTVASGRATSAAGTGKTSTELQSPTTATGIYSNWDTNNWDFGTSVQLPILKYHDACTTTAGQSICGTLLPNQGTGLRTLEVSASHVVPLLPVFSSEQSEYMADTPPGTDSINLRLISYDATAAFEIKKQGEDTNYFTDNEKSTIPVNDGEILTIQVTGAVADTAATTTTTYTLRMSTPPITLSEISVTKDGKDTGDTVSEGDDITLRATVGGSSGGYQYKWEQTSGEPLATTDATTDTLSIKIPDDFVKSAATTVTYTVTVTNPESNNSLVGTVSIALTIMKHNNGDLVVGLEEEHHMNGTTLTAVMRTGDPDGYDPDTIDYQWQKQVEGSGIWIDTGSAAKTYAVPQTIVGVDYRVKIKYTDNQGYRATAMTESYRYEAPEWEISVPEVAEDNTADTDSTVNEGSEITLNVIGSGDYQYEWTQTPKNSFSIPPAGSDELGFDIPYNFIKSATTTNSNVTFTVTITDSENHAITETKTLTVMKIDNSEPIIEALVGGTTLTAVVSDADDYDDNPNNNKATYQWQKRDGGSWVNIDEASTAIYKIPSATHLGVSHRVIVEYTDDQGYEKKVEKIYPGATTLFECDYATDISRDIDQDDDGLIEICSLEGLNAIRYQPDGTGYRTSTDTTKITIGCPADGCKGYELAANLDLSEEDNWLPIKYFAGIFEGNGYTISNLKINRPNTSGVGLFDYLENISEINNISLLNVNVKGDRAVGSLAGRNSGTIANSHATGSVSGNSQIGGLAGWNDGSIGNSYATGSIDGNTEIGGIVGHNKNIIRNSYATGPVVGDEDAGGLVGHNRGSIANSYAIGPVYGDEDVGGLTGENHKGRIANSYATGSVDGNDFVGGLTGWNSDGSIANSYAAGPVYGQWNVGGLTGWNYKGNIANSYWDTEASGMSTSAVGIGKTTAELQSPTAATGIYSEWSTDDWDFGSASQYPVLKDENGDLLSPAIRYGLSRLELTEGNLSPDFVALQPNYTGTAVNNTNTIQLIPTAVNPDARIRIDSGNIHDDIASGAASSKITLDANDITTITIVVINNEATIKYNLDINYYHSSEDIDKDDDGLIEIDGLEGLNAIRYQTDGTGYRTSSDMPKITLGCPADGCKGYELTADLDLSEEGNWLPINFFTGIFEGNGHTISNLKINRPNTNGVGLFGYIGRSAEINNISLLNVDIKGAKHVGSLAGWNSGSITDSYATGSVVGQWYVGGLIGYNRSSITNSYATGSVNGQQWYVGGLIGWNVGSITNSYATGSVNGDKRVGGLAGWNSGNITDSHATGSVDGQWYVGGLVGLYYSGSITNSYATGSVNGQQWYVGGLVGRNSSGRITNSYATGSIDGQWYVGGLVGGNFDGSITDSYATGSVNGENYSVGGLVGWNNGGRITNSYATGHVYGNKNIGGLVGKNGNNHYSGSIANSYATGSIDGQQNVGGLVGQNISGRITNSYATGSIDGQQNVGGLVGQNSSGRITNSYATSHVDGNKDIGGLVGNNYYGSVANSYWDTEVSGILISAGGTGKTTAELQSPTAATGIYAEWSTDDWDFGSASQYPVLKDENGDLLTTALLSRDIDKDDDGLIEIDDLEGLNAIRYQPDGTGYRTSTDTAKITIGCPENGCKGYELTVDLDLSAVDNWLPINAFTSIFEGNGHTISNLKINRPDADNVGLFGDIGRSAEINNLGLLNVDIRGNLAVGSLAGRNGGSITNSYATGSVNGDSYWVGGLIGQNNYGSITNSYATGSVKGNRVAGGLVGQNYYGSITNSYASGLVNGDSYYVGGLIGQNNYGSITNSYATGSVNGQWNVGGLVGVNYSGGSIANSYATGPVDGQWNVGGLVGQNFGSIANSYWDTDASGTSISADGTSKTTVDLQSPTTVTEIYRNWSTDNSDFGTPKTTAELQSPTTATGIYSSWSADNWDFGTSGQLPILKYHDACTTTTERYIGQPICGAFLPNQGTGLRTLEVSMNHVVPLLPVFSSEQSEYMADTPPGTDSINLRLISYDAGATFEIRKQGEDTNYFTDNEKSTIAVTDGEILTIQVTGAVADTTATTITSYTLQIGSPPITLPEISVTEVAEDDAADTDNTVNEGSEITLNVIGSGDYQYEWTQTPENSFSIPPGSNDELSFDIPYNFIKSATTTNSNVTFTVTITDSENNAITETKILTIAKIDNSEPIIEALVDGRTLTAVVSDADDYDDNPNNNEASYQWQKQDGSSWVNIDEASTAIYKIPSTTDLGVSHRVIVEYTDDQGYDKEVEKVYPGATTHFVCDYATDIDQDDDGLIEICGLEGFNAIRYQADGTGYRTSADTTKITIGCHADGCKGYELTGNLDLAEEDNWLPINAFTGIFEGNGHTISNLKINRPDAYDVGLFSALESGAEINNISLLNVDVKGNFAVGSLTGRSGGTIANSHATGSVSGNSQIGGLVGWNDGSIGNSYVTGSVDGEGTVGGLVGWNSGSITNSHATGSIGGDNYVGGLVGRNYTGSIANSHATGSVVGQQRHVGGLVGLNYKSSIANSYATGSVVGQQWYVGGLVGVNYSDGSIANSYAAGSVDGEEDVGGLVGLNYESSIANSYAIGSIDGQQHVGGLVGRNGGRITSSYWDTKVSGILISAGGTSKTTVELQSPTTATGIYSNWDTNNWDFGTSGQLPILKYHNACTTTTGQPICGALLPNQGTGLRTLEASTSHVVPLLPVFSSEQSEYMAATPPGTDSINLRLISYDAGATFEIRKQGENTNYFTDNEKSTIAVTDGEILTIQVTEAVADTTATTIISYTLQIGFPPTMLSEISVTEDGKDTGNTVGKGSDITLRAIDYGGSSSYQYEPLGSEYEALESEYEALESEYEALRSEEEAEKASPGVIRIRAKVFLENFLQ